MKNISTTSRIFFAAFQSLIIILGIWYAVFLYYVDILPNHQVEHSFIQSNCLILQSNLSVKKQLVHWYRADFKVTYSVQGPLYTSKVLGYGVDHAFTTDQAPQLNLLKRFKVSKKYPCWYSPFAPHIVVLAPKHRFSSGFTLFMDLIVVILAGYALVRNIFASIF